VLRLQTRKIVFLEIHAGGLEAGDFAVDVVD
jgi:hypothetical protein